MQNRTWHQACTNYRKITRQSILSSARRRESEGSGEEVPDENLHRKIQPRFPPSLPPLLSVRSHQAQNGVTLKERRATEIIPDNHHYIQRPRRNLLLNIVSEMRRLQNGRDGGDRYERRKKKREGRSCKILEPFRKTWESHIRGLRIYTDICCVTVDE